MKNLRRIFTFIITLCMCFSTMPAAAMTEEGINTQLTSSVEEVDYMNYDFPEDAEVLYQSEDGVVYITDTESDSSEIMPLADMQYNQVWIDRNKTTSGSFTVKNPHPLAGQSNGTLKLESEASDVQMEVVVSANTVTVKATTINANQEVHFSYKSVASNIVVHYYVLKKNFNHGMRLNCWIW